MSVAARPVMSVAARPVMSVAAHTVSTRGYVGVVRSRCRRSALVLAAAALAAVLAISGCGSKREPVTHHVAIRGMAYVPATLEVHVGDTVVWTNEDVLPHTVTSGVPSAATFDSGSIDAKREWRYEVRAAGETVYVCTFHPTMTGKLIGK